MVPQLVPCPKLTHTRLSAAILVCCFLAAPAAAFSQQAGLTSLDFATGSHNEDYLRALQLTGGAPLYPWSIRGFSWGEIEHLAAADTTGPWKTRQGLTRRAASAGPFLGGLTFNSAFPYGGNDGPLWAGRGLTVSLTSSIAGHAGPVSFSLAPFAFSAANRPFAIRVNGFAGPPAFNNASFPGNVDLPQRFGNSAYSRVDPGSSYLRFDSRFVALGGSTANEWIGPATEYPFLLSNNAPGFAHVFIGTGSPANIGIGQLHARVAWGRLVQSQYSPVVGPSHFVSQREPGTVRLATFAEAVFLPRGLPGLEVGVGRFFHVPYRAGEPAGDFWKKPFKVFFLKNEYAQGDTAGPDNQLASIFFRWTFPHSGFEVYGERGYEDQFYDFREFLENIDHDREYMIGFQKVLSSTAQHLDVLKLEVANYQLTTQAEIRVEGFVYVHSWLRQGHTNNGQLLGINAGVGAGAASTVSWTRYASGGRTALTLRRIVRDQRGNYFQTGIVDPRGSDVLVAVGFERTRFGRWVDFGGKIEAMDNFNRNFVRDVGNLNLQITTRLHR